MKTVKKVGLVIVACLFLVGLCQTLYASDNKININTASQEELMTLKGVNEALVQSIIDYRSVNPFNKVEDLMNVQGLEHNFVKDNIDNIVVE
jgi:competence ComEA-like helix-hairpin-helix protein